MFITINKKDQDIERYEIINSKNHNALLLQVTGMPMITSI